MSKFKKLSKDQLLKRELEAAQKDFEEQLRDQEEENDLLSDEEEEEEDDSDEEQTDQRYSKKTKIEAQDLSTWRNKQRVMTVCSRGTGMQYRHLMNDLRNLLPHSKKDVKLDDSDLHAVAELAEYQSCNNAIYFETTKKKDCFMYIGKVPDGPTAKFHISNVHTTAELKLTGNCLKGSRPLLLFDEAFEKATHLKIYKEIFIHTFGTPRLHKNSKPFIDHIICFFIQDNRIWFRNYQIHQREISKTKKEDELLEIGPQFVLTPVVIFRNSFSGKIIYSNPEYISPNALIQQKKDEKIEQYLRSKLEKQLTKEKKTFLQNLKEDDPFAHVFD